MPQRKATSRAGKKATKQRPTAAKTKRLGANANVQRTGAHAKKMSTIETPYMEERHQRTRHKNKQ